jgi:hypothetical protein
VDDDEWEAVEEIRIGREGFRTYEITFPIAVHV